MEQRNLKWREPAETFQSDQLLASRYGRLMQWATALTRGDTGKAEEIVQEFCLYITLAKPDLSGVANLDGYLYTCLRHIYLSSLARASREALHFVSIEDFDSFAFAVAQGDPLQRQNDLRRICAYAVWRKESSKSASYFILHFFHGYGRLEIAELARLPISAIYNKLKTARSEVRSHLEDPGKLRMVNRNPPPEPALSWSLLSPVGLFEELRQAILRARHSDCLPEDSLLAHYRSPAAGPISCSLLAHIVSCERCLSVVDRHLRRPTLKDREPLDALGFSSDGSDDATTPGGAGAEAMLRSVHKKWARIHEHRPRTLSIAVNGRVVAYHDVRAEHNKLSARLDHPEKAQFVEVFSEQQVRLALLAVGEAPPEGPAAQTQRVGLSDARWLELSLTFDGLGLHSEVAYFDPALAIVATEEDEEEVPLVFETNAPGLGVFVRFLRGLGKARTEFNRHPVPSSAMAWALGLVILIGGVSYFAYRRTHLPMDAAEILHQSLTTESADLQGQTEHQVLHLEESSADGRILQQGVVELWKDGNGSRYIRRLYDAQHRMISVEWRGKDGKAGSRSAGRARGSSVAQSSAISLLWDQDLSAQAFAAMGDRPPQLRAIDGGYELTRVGSTAAYPQLVSATLVLDRHLQPVRQIMRVRTDGETHELRFVQANYERKPARSVPDGIFNPDSDELPPRGADRHSGLARPHNLVGYGAVQLAELQIAVLHQLHALGADTGVPIEVVRTPEGHVRVSGAVPSEMLKQAINAHLRGLANHQLLDLKIVSPRDVRIPASGSRRSDAVGTSVYEVNETKSAADATIRGYLQSKGLSGDRLDAEVAKFSRDALQHAQRALQHAYALDRLGSGLSTEELRSVSITAQQQWTDMVENHASDLAAELRALHGQLAEILPVVAGPATVDTEHGRIDDPAQLDKTAGLLLHQVRDINQKIGAFFASGGTPENQKNLNAELTTIMDTIPLRQAEAVARLAVRLSSSEDGKRIAAQTQ